MHAPGFWNIILILAIVVLLFGGKKLPELGGAFGEALKNFKKSVKDGGTATTSTAQNQSPTMEPPKALPQAQVHSQPQPDSATKSQT